MLPAPPCPVLQFSFEHSPTRLKQERPPAETQGPALTAHGPLWDALRKKGRQVRVIGIAVQNAVLDRTARVLERWAAAEPGTTDEGLTVKQEIKAIDEAMTRKDREFLARYGGFAKAGRRSLELMRLPEANLTEGVKIDDYSTYRATRFADPNEIG